MLRELAECISKEIKKGLPGREIQYRMAPAIRLMTDPFLKNKQDAGVLILFYPSKHPVNLILIKRTDYQGVHGGQISFPGGKSEPRDKDICQTAIREAEEELGIDLQKIRLIGMLTELHIPVSNITVIPVIGYLEKKPVFKPGASEVEYVIEVELEELLNPGNVKYSYRKIMSVRTKIPYYDIYSHRIWGATAMIISELIEIINRGGLSHQG
jgi:8-oxo-dGTP pyrophosphatase MutT (NUDIX family)